MQARPTGVALLALVLVGACGGQGGTLPPTPARSSDVVTMEELGRMSTSSSLFEALHALRPAWFHRNPTTLRPQAEGDVVIYLDQSRLGGPETLRTIQVGAVTVIRHYSPSEAQAQFGPGHLHGAILVSTAR